GNFAELFQRPFRVDAHDQYRRRSMRPARASSRRNCGSRRGGPGFQRSRSMFFTYLRRELRRRMRQAVLIALGLALGIGLGITVNAASSGVKAAQGTVLQKLCGLVPPAA